MKQLIPMDEQFPLLTQQMKILHPDAKPDYYSNECDMLNRIVLGMTARQYKITHDLPHDCNNIRPYLRDDQVAMLDHLQIVDIGLMLGVPDFQQRKRHLEWCAMSTVGLYGTNKNSIVFPNASEPQ